MTDSLKCEGLNYLPYFVEGGGAVSAEIQRITVVAADHTLHQSKLQRLGNQLCTTVTGANRYVVRTVRRSGAVSQRTVPGETVDSGGQFTNINGTDNRTVFYR